MAEVAKTACKECPFKRTAIPGWLGSARTPEDFLGPHWHGALKLPCHMTIDWERGREAVIDQAASAPHCRGLMVMLRNSCKIPYDTDMREARDTVEPDPENFFRFPHEFYGHHRMQLVARREP